MEGRKERNGRKGKSGKRDQASEFTLKKEQDPAKGWKKVALSKVVSSELEEAESSKVIPAAPGPTLDNLHSALGVPASNLRQFCAPRDLARILEHSIPGTGVMAQLAE